MFRKRAFRFFFGLSTALFGDQVVRTLDAGSNPGRHAVECNPGQVVYTQVPLSLSSIIWYQPMGGDAYQPGR